MYFQIKKIVLWPRKKAPPREIELHEGRVNVISGASKTGKSAVIPIVDYCLCANRCAIPVGVIRDACEWFGVLVSTAEGEKLFARREPGDQKQTGDMFVLEGTKVEIPEEITAKNANADQVKATLNRLAGLSSLGMTPDSESYRSERTSFRDLMAFTFQPQNIIANPDVVYFKTDTTEHREKLRAVFPYVLNAVTPQILADRWEIDRLQKELRQKESALAATQRSVDIWVGEATSWIQQGKELGLLDEETRTPARWLDMLSLLRRLVRMNYREARPTISGIEGVLQDLANLQDLEAQEATKLSVCRQRLNEIRRLIDSSKSFGDALYIQRDRLDISNWIRNLSEDRRDALSALVPDAPQHIDSLCDALSGLELELRAQSTISDRLDKEQLRLRVLAEESIARLNQIRSQIRDLERRSEEARTQAYRADSIERYLGRLEQALKLYESAGEDAELRQEVEQLSATIDEIRSRISEQQIAVRIRNALTTIEGIAGQIIPTLDAEWPDASVSISISDLTLKVIQGTRDNYLWEIGSGANWLAYHISVSLAFQRFFLQTPHHAVPSFLVYDQPSQVYFPKSPHTKDTGDVEWHDEDIDAVRKIFDAVSRETLRANSRLQIIVLDHADERVWGEIDNVILVEEWREGRKLVPPDWLIDEDG